MAIGAALALVLLWLLFRQADWTRLTEELRHARPVPLVLAVALFTAAHFMRGWRWRRALSLRGPVRWHAAHAATQIAQFANLALPVRGGPILRGLVLSRLSGVPFAYAVGAAFADRAAEGTVLAVGLLFFCLALTQGGMVPPSATADALVVLLLGFAALVLLVTSALLAIAALPEGTRLPWGAAQLAQRVPAWGAPAWAGFRAGIRATIRSGAAVPVWLGAAGAWAGMIAGHAAALHALNLPWTWQAAALSCALAVATIVLPGTPGLIGPYHAAVVSALAVALPATTPEQRLAAAIVVHAVHAGSIAVLGTMALVSEHQSLWQLEAAEESLHTRDAPTGSARELKP